MTTRHTLLLLIALASFGCASAPPPAGSGPGPSASVNSTETGAFIRLNSDSRSTSVSLDATPQKIWAVMPGVYAKLGVPAETVDAAQRTIGTKAYTQSRLDGKRTTDWLRCGNQGAGPSSGGMFRTRVTVMTTVREVSGGKTDLVTEVAGIATPVEGTSTGAVTCASTGELEQRIFRLVSEAIAP